MTDELMEQRIAELNAHRTENTPVFNSEKRTYSVDDIMSILDISRSSAYILIKKDFFRSVKIGNQLRISKASFDKWLDNRTFESNKPLRYNVVKAFTLATLASYIF